MSSLSFQRQIFVSDSSVKYTWEPAFIKMKLYERYGDEFDPSKVDEYDNYLAQIKSETAEILSSQTEPIVRIIENANCPICGASIINDDKWFGKYTRTPGWRCTEGGSLHFIQWKANRICSNRNEKKPFEEMGEMQSVRS